MKFKLAIVLTVVTFTLILSSCNDDQVFYTGSDASLTLRSDTIFFDTVFTSNIPRIPLSVNKQLVVVNPLKEAVKTDFMLYGGSESVFRINVDGEVGPSVSDIEIGPGDSIFVFVELSVDENDDPQSLPLIVRDSLSISTNGNQQQVQLMAWGQDAEYFFRDTLCDVTFSDKQKPYVVYGYLYVPENCKLTIEEGVKMHFAPRSWLYVEGTLEIRGTKDEPVEFQGDRLQPDFEEVAGQWGGIWIDKLSRGSTIKHAIIKNGTVGIYCDSTTGFSYNMPPAVVVDNTLVRNMSFDGLSGKSARIIARNSIFTNCGRYSFLGLFGGVYDLKHCTFATYGYDFARRDPTFVVNNVRLNDFNQIVQVYPTQYDVANCLIDGSLESEAAFATFTGIDEPLLFGDTSFHHNLVKHDRKLDYKGMGNVIVPMGEDAGLVNPQGREYRLLPSSKARDIGDPIPGISLDYLEATRDAKPDAGAIEFVP